MSELVALYLTSIFLIGALLLLGRHNQHTGWRRKRGNLVKEIQETMENLRIPQPIASAAMLRPGVLTPEAKVTFSMQLLKLQSRLAAQGGPAPENGDREPAGAKEEANRVER